MSNRIVRRSIGAGGSAALTALALFAAFRETANIDSIDILKPRLAARGIDIRCMEEGDPEINLATATQKITLKQGIDQPTAKDIIKRIKDAKLKVNAQIEGDKLRVQGKKRDDLQAAIALLREAELKLPLQFENFRD